MWSDRIDALKRQWTDKYVRVREGRPELARFAGQVGRVVTVNCSGRLLVDFADGAWYDLPASEEWVTVVEDASGYDPTANSAQARPTRQA